MKTEYNFLYTSAGKNDECYTPREGVTPMLDYLPYFIWEKYGEKWKKKDIIIWCPFDTPESEFVKVFIENGYNVVYSDIKTGQDFYEYEPEKWDIIISNPPFTNKRAIFERALSFNKPFALLMTAAWLNDKAPCDLFYQKGLQLLMFDDRLKFKNQSAKRINFKSIYYCRYFLPRDIMIEKLPHPLNR